MLFSNQDVAATINHDFEPVWQSLRPVPMVTIDFGNGIVLKRTLHGNIATMICGRQSEVLDILPGIYDPITYAKQLTTLSQLSRRLDLQRIERTRLRERMKYHRRELKRIESQPQANPGSSEINDPAIAHSGHDLVLANKAALHSDTLINNGPRRAMIHRKLLTQSNMKPSDLTKWLYREVLHADLEDPYMGLRETLVDTHPFK